MTDSKLQVVREIRELMNFGKSRNWETIRLHLPQVDNLLTALDDANAECKRMREALEQLSGDEVHKRFPLSCCFEEDARDVYPNKVGWLQIVANLALNPDSETFLKAIVILEKDGRRLRDE